MSHVTAWEIQIKHQKHPRRFPFSLDDLERAMRAFACAELQLEYDDIRVLDGMRLDIPDPFDRMLISQAAKRSIPLATLDRTIIAAQRAIKTFETLS